MFLNYLDGFIDADMSDMLRSSPSPVDKNISTTAAALIAIICVVGHDIFGCIAAVLCTLL